MVMKIVIWWWRRCWWKVRCIPLQWRYNGRDGVSNHQLHDCLLNRLFRRTSKKTSKLRVTGLCAGNSPVTGEFPAQRASTAEDISIWWRHRDISGPDIDISDSKYMHAHDKIVTTLLKFIWYTEATTTYRTIPGLNYVLKASIQFLRSCGSEFHEEAPWKAMEFTSNLYRDIRHRGCSIRELFRRIL